MTPLGGCEGMRRMVDDQDRQLHASGAHSVALDKSLRTHRQKRIRDGGL